MYTHGKKQARRENKIAYFSGAKLIVKTRANAREHSITSPTPILQGGPAENQRVTRARENRESQAPDVECPKTGKVGNAPKTVRSGAKVKTRGADSK